MNRDKNGKDFYGNDYQTGLFKQDILTLDKFKHFDEYGLQGVYKK